MKRLTLILIIGLLPIMAFAERPTDLSGPIAIKGVLLKPYQNYPEGTEFVIRQVIKMRPIAPSNSGIYYALQINHTQFAFPQESMDMVKLNTPENNKEFWQQVYLRYHMYEYFNKKGHHNELRKEIDEECSDYLDKLKDIAYQDDYITSYVQSIFAKFTATGIDPNRKDYLNVRVIQSPDPNAYMLPNGTMLVSTGLLCTLDSEDELAAIIVEEMAHYVLDHQIRNVYHAQRSAERAAFWGSILSATADAAFDVAYWNDDDKALGIGVIASIGSIATLLSVHVIDRLGMDYTTGQENAADRIAREMLTFSGMNPDGLSSALSKIVDYYNTQRRRNDLMRYGSIKNLEKRITKSGGETKRLSSHLYLKMTSDVVTFNAAMNIADQRYTEVEKLIQKNIDNHFATDNDYVILAKSKMALYNTQETNEECLSLLQKAQTMAGSSPNLDIYKQKILLLLRMNKQIQAADTLKEYVELLTQFQSQGTAGEDKDWTAKEIDWANHLLDKINRP